MSLTLLFFVFSCLCFSGSIVRAEDSLLKIRVLSGQNSVKGGMMFLVHVQVANSSSDTLVDFWSNTCSYEKHWVTDNPGVFIQPWTCNENAFEQILLKPDDIYEKNIILYIPKKDKTEPVTFRLGFRRMSEDGDVAEPLWSDPVTMNVIVPEEMKEATSPAVAKIVSQVSDQASATSLKMNKISPAIAADSAVLAGSRSLEFQDSGVPIIVRSGEEFSISLVSNATTGYRWKMTLPEEQKIVKSLGSEYVAPQRTMMGAPGEEVYKFKAVTPGKIKIDFVYKRSWESETAPTRKIFTVLVQED